MPSNLKGLCFLKYSLSGDNSSFIKALNKYLVELNENKSNAEDHFRLLEKGEYDAAVIAAFRLLETTLSDMVDTKKSAPFLSALNLLNTNNERDKMLLQKVKEYRKVRNNIVHANARISKGDATDIVTSIDELCKSIKTGNIIVL